MIPLFLNTPYLIYKSILWVKSKNMIDLILYAKNHKMNEKSSYPNKPLKLGSLYPAQ